MKTQLMRKAWHMLSVALLFGSVAAVASGCVVAPAPPYGYEGGAAVVAPAPGVVVAPVPVGWGWHHHHYYRYDHWH